MTRYGFETNGGETHVVEADSLAEGIAMVEEETHLPVVRGRSLDGYDGQGARSDEAQRDFIGEWDKR